MSVLEQAVDITRLDLAQKVHSRVLAGHYAEQLDAMQDAARQLGYYFAQAEFAEPIPDVLSEVLTEAIMFRKEASLIPNDGERARRRAGQAIEDGFGDLLRDEILGALEEQGIRLQATIEAYLLVTSAKIARDEPPAIEREIREGRTLLLHRPDDSKDHPARVSVPLSVDVTKEEIVISGEGSLATYNWKPDSWGNGVKRLSIRASHKRTGDVEEDVYSVVAGDGEESGRKGGVIAEDLSKEEALALIKRIQDGVRESLGITQVSTHVVELPVAQPDPYDSGSQPEKAQSIATRIGSAAWSVLSAGGLIVVAIAVLCTLAFGLPVAYKAGQHFSSNLFSVADTGDVRSSDLYGDAMLPVVPLPRARPLSPLPRALPRSQVMQQQ
jgi:hypothetical protein